MLRGIDVSGAETDWREARRAGAVFGGFKLSEGQDYRDPKGTRGRYDAAHRAGMFVMPGYHFLRPKRRDPTLEMRWYLRCMRSLGYPSKGDLPPVVDIETTELGPRDTLAYLETACRYLLARGTHPHGIVIYGSPAFLNQIGVGGSAYLREQERKRRIRWWIAHEGPPAGRPQLPNGVRTYVFHQHDLDTTWQGVDGPCDRNVARPDIDERKLRSIAYGRGGPKPRPPEPPSVPGRRTREIQRLLVECGWPLRVDGDLGPRTRQAIRDFKRGFALGATFRSFHAEVGPVTMRRLRQSAARDGACSEHFKFREFASSRSGWIRTHHELVRGLERLRRDVGHGIGVLSGYRDFALGASKSQHLHGNAIDPTARLPLDACLRAGAFSGIGLQPGTREVRHLDVRHVGPNYTGGTPSRPTVFVDAF
jgi:GH25 family lysozyme M1 (1,4-beta-N-acetylmuramidase)